MSPPRRWLVLGVRSPAGEEQAGLLAEGLVSLGARAVWEEDAAAGTGTRGVRRLVTHLPEPDDAEAFARRAQAHLRALTGLPDLVIETAWQAHEDWAETWKRGLAPRRVTPRLVVAPSWETPEAAPGEVVIVVDPGMAFGNAEHGTTRGCLRLLDGALSPGERVLDVGSGSAVLAIAAARLGAGEVVAVEGDPDAVETARENLARNDVVGRVTLQEVWADADALLALGAFDGALANLEGATLHRLLGALAGCVRPGGWLILSGIGPDELDGLLEACRPLGLTEQAVDSDGEWRSLLLRRLGPGAAGGAAACGG